VRILLAPRCQLFFMLREFALKHFRQGVYWLAILGVWMVAPVALADQAAWNESNIRHSFEAASGVAAGNQQLPCDKAWQVSIDSNAAGVTITDSVGAVRQLALHEGLLAQWHRSASGCAVVLASRDGWVFRLDLRQAVVSAKVRVGLRVRGTVLSEPRAGQPALLAVTNDLPHTLPILDEYLQLQKLISVTGRYGQNSSAVLGIVVSAPRQSFVLALQSVPELWELSYNPKAPEIALGMVHDFQYREGSFVPGYLNPQRISLTAPATQFRLSDDGHEVWSVHARASDRQSASIPVVVTHLDVRRQIAELTLPVGMMLDRLAR